MDQSEHLQQYLKIQPTDHGQVHLDYLVLPTVYPDFLCSRSPEQIRQNLAGYGINLTPLIVRRISPETGETLYEVIFGKEVVEFARELGISKLWAWMVNVQDGEVPLAQQKLANLFQIGSPIVIDTPPEVIDTPTSSKESRSSVTSPVQPDLSTLHGDIKTGFQELLAQFKQQTEEIRALKDQAQRQQQYLQESVVKIVEKIDGIVLPPPPLRPKIHINKRRNVQSLVKDIPRLTKEEATKIINARKEGGKFTSVTELKQMAPSGQWDAVDVQF